MTSVLTNEPTFELKLTDRCDRCGEASQAFAVAYKLDSKTGETKSVLLFCGHHIAEYGANLMAQGFIIQDERYKINERAESGTPVDYVPGLD